MRWPGFMAPPEGIVDPTILALLAEIDEEAALSSLLGVDLTPPAPSSSHASMVYPPLDASGVLA